MSKTEKDQFVNKALLGYIAFLTSCLTILGGFTVNSAYKYAQHLDEKVEQLAGRSEDDKREHAAQAVLNKQYEVGLATVNGRVDAIYKYRAK